MEMSLQAGRSDIASARETMGIPSGLPPGNHQPLISGPLILDGL
jgi:hypothetical protein